MSFPNHIGFSLTFPIGSMLVACEGQNDTHEDTISDTMKTFARHFLNFQFYINKNNALDSDTRHRSEWIAREMFSFRNAVIHS